MISIATHRKPISLECLKKDLSNLYLEADMHDYLTDIDLVLCEILCLKKHDLILKKELIISPEQIKEISSIIQNRLKRIPLQYLLKKTEFYGLGFMVSNDTFIPRPETEIIVERISEYIRKRTSGPHILEIGTGSGNIAISLAVEFAHLKIIATDISFDALKIACKNSFNHHTNSAITFITGNLFSIFRSNNKFDIIVSNPPYIPESDINKLQEEVKYYEPETSLYGGKDGLKVIKKILDEGSDYLAKDGKLFLEIGHGQGNEIISYIDKQRFSDCIIHKDYNGLERILEATKRSTM